MTPLMFLSLVGLVYSIVYLLDTLLRSHPSTSLWYLIKLRSLGLDVSLFQVKWSTARYNSTFQRLSQIHPRLVRVWYSLGAVFSSLLILPSVLLLLHSLHQHISPRHTNSTSSSDRVVLQPILPGVNLPPSELVYYLTSLLACSVYHETGHAVAAYNCGVRVLCAGLVVLAIFPAAYVELPTEQLQSMSHLHQLRVFSAGVWHNTVLAVFAWLLASTAPTLLSPGYAWGDGVMVVRVELGSSLEGPSGLMVGDVIKAIQGRPVNNIRDYKVVLAEVITRVQGGLCVEDELVQELRVTGGAKCCPSERTDSLCFTNIRTEQSDCLPVRTVYSRTGGRTCDSWDPFDSQEDVCGEKAACMVPQFGDNTTKLVMVRRREQKDFLFIGNPAEIYSYSEITEYVPKYSFLPLALPDMLVKLCNYMAAFSAALAVLNVVPSYLLDGQHMARVLVEMFLGSFTEKARTNVTIGVTVFGTVLIFTNILLGLKSVLTSGGDSLVSFSTV